MKKINLSILFWVLASFSFLMPFSTMAGISMQYFALIQAAGVLGLAGFYWMNQRQAKAHDDLQNELRQEETQNIIQRSQHSIEALLSSVESAAHASERSASDIDSLNNLVQTTSENAKQAAMLSHQSRTTVESSVTAISELYNSMNEVSTSSKKIEEILRMIEDIAFQTNLLALNAAVEAARAGEQGKGFAVVAEAVRTLAQKSSTAAKDISALINDNTENIRKGCEQAQSSRELLNGILSGILKVSDINNEISLSSQEQASSTRQLRASLTELTDTQNAIIQKIKSSNKDQVLKPLTLRTPKVETKPVVEHKPAVEKSNVVAFTASVAKPKDAVTAKRSFKKEAAPTVAAKAKPSLTPSKPTVAATKAPLVATDTAKDTSKTPAPPVEAKAEATEAKPAAKIATTPVAVVKEAPVAPIKKAKRAAFDPNSPQKALTTKSPQDLIPFDEDDDRLKLGKASDF